MGYDGAGDPDRPDADSKGGVPVATRSRGEAGTTAAESKRRKRKPEVNQEEEEILKRAQI